MSDELRREEALDRFWDSLTLGREPRQERALDPEQREMIRRFQALAKAPTPEVARERVWRRLRVQIDATPGSPLVIGPADVDATSRTVIGPNGHSASSVRRWAAYPVSPKGRHWLSVQFATALLLLLLATLIGISMRLGPHDDPADLPATVAPTLLGEANVDGIPERAHLYLHWWIVAPGASARDESGGVVLGGVRWGTLALQIGSEAERILSSGDGFAVPPNTPYTIRNAGATSATYLEVKVNDEPGGWALDDSFAGDGNDQQRLLDQGLREYVTTGPARVSLERLTLAPDQWLVGPLPGLGRYQAFVIDIGALGISKLESWQPPTPGTPPTFETSHYSGAWVPRFDDASGPYVLSNAGPRSLTLFVVRIESAPDMRRLDDRAP